MTDFKAELVASDGSRILLEGEQRVGRSADCDITIDDSKVSRAHAVLRVKGESLTVEDLGSANGTTVNQRACSGETTLRDGDTLAFDKHSYVVALAGGDSADATVVNAGDDGDATVVSAGEPEPEVASAPEPPPEPKPEPKPEPPPGPSDLPGSWIDSGTSEGTQVLGLDALEESEGGRVQMERASDLPHLIVVAETGEGGSAIELEPGDGSEPDVWEIGRDPKCEVALDEASVSARHAQLIHEDGRWKMVNLLAANGIFVNGEKRLTAYLADGDEIRLGAAILVFRAGVGEAGKPKQKPKNAPKSSPAAGAAAGSGDNKGMLIGIVAAVVLAVAGAAAYFFLG